MARHTAPQREFAVVGEARVVSVDYEPKLDAGENLDALVTPTVLEKTTADLVFSNIGVSTVELTINGRKVPAGRAVQFKVSGQKAGVLYRLLTKADSDSTPPQTNLTVELLLTGIEA